jgi:hypothetical protein
MSTGLILPAAAPMKWLLVDIPLRGRLLDCLPRVLSCLKTHPVSATKLRIFHHDSITFREGAHFDCKTNYQRGCPIDNCHTSVGRWGLK